MKLHHVIYISVIQLLIIWIAFKFEINKTASEMYGAGILEGQKMLLNQEYATDSIKTVFVEFFKK